MAGSGRRDATIADTTLDGEARLIIGRSNPSVENRVTKPLQNLSMVHHLREKGTTAGIALSRALTS